MSLHAITVLGRDRPGIIAETTAALAGLGLNLEDSSMTLLRGQFAMTLVTAGEAPAGAIEAALEPLTADGALAVSVREAAAGHAPPAAATYLLSVHGGDRPGIVSAVTAEVARVGGNITDLTTRLAGDLYVLTAECSFPPETDLAALGSAIQQVAERLGVGATLREVESDEL
ncbi:MAG TPA: ACT domain-containing protein [Marmoricola sp.]|nr:ACT domain-containing protein [Marmoricola sp.]